MPRHHHSDLIRRILRLHMHQGLTLKEIAEHLSMPYQTIFDIAHLRTRRAAKIAAGDLNQPSLSRTSELSEAERAAPARTLDHVRARFNEARRRQRA